MFGDTPVAQDAFSRFMADMFDDKQIIGVSTAFQAFFGNAGNGAQTVFSPDANTIDIDIIRGNEKIAALIPRGTISRPLGGKQKNLNVEKYTSFARKFPLSEEEGDITADQLVYRMAGEGPTARRTRLDRMRSLALKLHLESIRRSVRMFEVLAAQSVIEGKQDAIIGTTNPDLQYDFRRNAAHTISVPIAWDQATAVILTNIDAACDLSRQNGKITPDFIGMGGSAVDLFIKDDVVQAQADNRRFELIEVSTGNPVPERFNRFVEGGWTARGRLRTPKGYELWIFTNVDGYENDAGAFIPHMPIDKAFVASSRSRNDRYFGPPETLPMIPQRVQLYQELFGFDPGMAPMPPNVDAAAGVINPAMFYADAYVSGDWKKVSVRTQSAPIFATTHTDSFVVLEDLVTP